MAKELEIKISKAQDKLLESTDFLDTKTTIIPKVKKKAPAKYVPVKKDFIKVDRWVIDLVIPFLNSNCSAGASVLYLDLYRMSYGYGKNVVQITDEIIQKRTAIPKRTIMTYKKMLSKYDLIDYKKGHRTRRGQFTIKRPDQSVYFADYIHNSAQQTTKSVGSTDKKPTLYNIDKLYIDSETLVLDFYSNAGWKKSSITRDLVDNGIKIINKLYQQKYDIDFIKDLMSWSIKYCKENNKPIYGIGFINYLMPEYISTKEKKDNQKKRRAAEMEKAKKRNDELEREQMLLQKYNIMPNHIKSRIMAQAKHKVEDALKDNNNKKIGQYLEKFMIEGYITEIMEDEYSGL